MKTRNKTLRTLSISAALVLSMPQVHALEIGPGDYEQVPGGLNVGILYYQIAQREKLRNDGETLTDNFNLDSNVSILRFIRAKTLSKSSTVDLNVILPIGELNTSGDAAPLGDADGVGDLTLGLAWKRIVNEEKKSTLSGGVFWSLPTGSYDNSRALNLGENRNSVVLQLVYIDHFKNGWALDTAADIKIFEENDSFGASSTTLKQKPRYEFQTLLRKQVSEPTELSVGLGYVIGGETEVGGVDQDDELKTSYARLTVSHFVKPDLQLQAQFGTDISVEEGPMEKSRLNLRLVKIF